MTLQREVAIAAPERESSPKWPNINMGETRRRYCDNVTTIIGSAIKFTRFSSPANATHPHSLPLLDFFSKGTSPSIFRGLKTYLCISARFSTILSRHERLTAVSHGYDHHHHHKVKKENFIIQKYHKFQNINKINYGIKNLYPTKSVHRARGYVYTTMAAASVAA